MANTSTPETNIKQQCLKRYHLIKYPEKIDFSNVPKNDDNRSVFITLLCDSWNKKWTCDSYHTYTDSHGIIKDVNTVQHSNDKCFLDWANLLILN